MGYKGLSHAPKRRKLEIAGIGTHPRNTTAVKTALRDLNHSRPEAVVIVGAGRAVAAFIRWARLLEIDPAFVNISFVGSDALGTELGVAGDGVLVTQVVPFPGDDSIPVVAHYRRARSAERAGVRVPARLHRGAVRGGSPGPRGTRPHSQRIHQRGDLDGDT